MRSSFLATVVQSSYALRVRHSSGADEQPFDMAFTALCATAMLLGAIAADAPVPRTTWEQQETHLKLFQQSGVFNYSILLLSEETDVLYIGAREAIFAVNALNVSEKQHEVTWGVNEDKQKECSKKGKSIQTECLNYVRVLQALNSSVLYVCGTNAFQPTCSYLSISPFQMVAGRSDDGKGRSPFDPAHSYTSVMVDGELYSGTSFTFLGGEPIILRHSQNGQLRTEYAVPWLNEPRFVFSDVIREYPSGHGDDDKVYFFFTEVSVEYEFVNKLLIPRIARVCKNDYGGLRTLQKKWTSFLKAKLICSIPEKNLVFNIVNDVFILKPPRPAEPVIYGIFTSQLNNVGVSAVCAYNISTVEDVFTKGKYMHSTTVESHTKWVQYNGNVPSPRPGACINAQARAMNFSTSLDLPDKTLQFVKDHPLMNDLVTPVGNKPKLVKHNVKYTQIVVDRVKALDNNLHDVMFISTDKGTLHKAVNYANEMFIIEEIELFPKSEPVQTLILSSKEGKKLIYAGSNIGVVQSPLAFCEKYSSCVDCVLARDPYCAWQQETSSCIHLPASSGIGSELIQKLNGDASSCPNKSKGVDRRHMLNLGSSLKLKCSQKSNLATVFWKFKGDRIKAEGPKYYLLGEDLFIFNITEDDIGDYQCLSEEDVRNVKYSQVLAKHILDLKKVPQTTTTVGPTRAAAQTEGNDTPNMSTMGTEVSATQTSTSQTVTPSTTTSTVLTNPTSHVLMSTASLTNIFSADPDISLKKTLYLTKANDTPLFTYLFVLFFVLFMCLLTYNCYKGFLPEHCLKYRSAMLPGKEKVVSDFVDCEPGLKETLVEQPSTQTQSGEQPKASRDTGYETDPECGNGKIPHAHETETIEEDDSEKPFDVNCELKFADSDVEGD